MAELKTKATAASVDAFLDAIPSATVRDDCRAIRDLMATATGAPAKMWGSGIIGFGDHRSRDAKGKVVEWMYMGFAPRKTNIALYHLRSAPDSQALLDALGINGEGKGCVYVNRLASLDLAKFRKLLASAASERAKSSDASLVSASPAASKKASASKVPAKKAPAKKAAAKTASPKKAPAKKAPARKSSAKKVAKRAPAKR